jgi:hypothetical protein
MRVLLMVVVAGLLFVLPMAGNIGPVELLILAGLWLGWFVALFAWALPGDRRAKGAR